MKQFLIINLCLVLVAPMAFAMDPFEIQVYTDDLKEPNQSGLEIHQNYIPRGNLLPNVSGGLADHHLWRTTLEFSRGISPGFDVGFYYQTAFKNDQGYYGGSKLRAKYLSKSSSGGFAGVNIEVGRAPVEFDPDEWGSEIRPILGFNGEKWIVSLNPILEFALGKGSRVPGFEPQLKVGRHVSKDLDLGFEYYADLGPIDAVPAIEKQDHNLFLIADKEFKSGELNFGVGRGLTSSAKSWTIKMIIGIDL